MSVKFSFSGTVTADAEMEEVLTILTDAFDKHGIESTFKLMQHNFKSPETTILPFSDGVVVAAVPIFDGWSAFIGVVNADNQCAVADTVRTTGVRLKRNVAEVLFPQFDPAKYTM